MANLYGPMAFRPNPGISLNSAPVQGFQPPAAAAPVQQAGRVAGPNIVDWGAENGMRFNDSRSGNSGNAMMHAKYNQYLAQNGMAPSMAGLSGGNALMALLGQQKYPQYYAMNSGGASGGGVQAPRAPAGGGGIGLDQVAASYAKFLNGGQ